MEAKEEAGVRGVTGAAPLTRYLHKKGRGKKAPLQCVEVYVLCARSFKPRRAERGRRPRWVTAAEASVLLGKKRSRPLADEVRRVLALGELLLNPAASELGFAARPHF